MNSSKIPSTPIPAFLKNKTNKKLKIYPKNPKFQEASIKKAYGFQI